MRENGVNGLFGIAPLAEDLRSFIGVLARRAVIGVRPALVVKIVEQRRHSPQFLVPAEFAGVGANAGLDGQRMLAQALALGVFTQQLPRIVAIRHSSSLPPIN